MVTYKLIWDDFCSWYLEMVKPGMGVAMKPSVLEATVNFFESLMKLLHPFMPFITEELWHSITERNEKDCIIIAPWPVTASADMQILQDFEAAMDLITSIRNVRKSKNIANKEPLSVSYLPGKVKGHEVFHAIVTKLCNLESLESIAEKPTGQVSILIRNHEYFIRVSGLIDQQEERKKIHAELDYTKSFLESVMKKLGNERFVSNAKPEILALEQKKKSDAEAKILMLEKQLETL
jgi:valyl-tRNA synthetase